MAIFDVNGILNGSVGRKCIITGVSVQPSSIVCQELISGDEVGTLVSEQLSRSAQSSKLS